VELLRTFATQSALAIQNARLFREIETKGRELEVASRHKSQFLANMSHELRTPLNAILGYTELIIDAVYGEPPPRMREVLERIEKAGRHLLGLINDVLDLSKIEAGQLTLAVEDYSIRDVVLGVASATEALATAKGLELAVAVPDDPPPARGDARRLTQVLLNIVGNAIKFTDHGRVAVATVTGPEGIQVSVADTGPGVAAGDLERIFEEFQQADTTTTRAKGGTGLGLAIARRIVEMHGGRQGGTPMSRRRILVVDDHEDNRRILRDLLTAAGFEVVEAVDGEQAVATAAGRPDLILMDIQLPGVDGYEATRRIKADPALRAIPLIVVTSYALSGDDARARAAGADAYVAKPFSPRSLLGTVRRHLEGPGGSA
jgi:CheY-like chemotaxis protein